MRASANGKAVFLRTFGKKEDGSVTIEFVLWLPLLMALVLMATDASVAFMRQSHMWQVSRDTARIVSRRSSLRSLIGNNEMVPCCSRSKVGLSQWL